METNMKNCDNLFYDITIKELAAQTLRHWRSILAAGLILAVVVGLYKSVPVYIRAADKELAAASLEAYEEEKAILGQEVERAQSLVDEKERQFENYIYYNLEWTMIQQGCLSFYINTPLTDETVYYQKNLVYAYISLIDSGQIQNTIAETLGGDIEAEDLKKIIKSESDPDAPGFLNIYIYGLNDQQVSQIMELVKQQLIASQASIASAVVPHSIALVSEDISVVSDEDLRDALKDEKDNLSTLKSNLSEKQAQYNAMDYPSVSMMGGFVSGMKYGLAGLFGGIILLILFYACCIILSDKVKSRKQLKDSYGINVLGEYIHRFKKQNSLDRYFSKMAGEPSGVPQDEMDRIIAQNIEAISDADRILLLGCEHVPDMQPLQDRLSACGILKGRKISTALDAVNKSDSLSGIFDAEAVVIIAKKDKTPLAELKMLKDTIDTYRKVFIGDILE
jgi:capsular polysaccharide biosynthesis protein